MLGAAHAGDARRARQAARLGGQATRVTGGDGEAGARDRVRRDRRRRRARRSRRSRRRWAAARGQLAIDDDERAVRPPRPEHRVNLQPERPGPAQPGRAPEALERNQRLGAVEREVDRVRDAERRERRGGRSAVGDALREPVERVRRAVAGLRAASARTDRRTPARPNRRSPPRARRGSSAPSVSVETGAQAASNAAAPSGTTTFSPHAAERALERREDRRVVRRRRARACYFSWNGYGVENPSEGGKQAVLTAVSTQVPVGVPANLPVTVAVVTLPFLPMTTLTIAVPGTLNWL